MGYLEAIYGHQVVNKSTALKVRYQCCKQWIKAEQTIACLTCSHQLQQLQEYMQSIMKAIKILSVILLFIFTEQTTAQRDVCPSCFILDNRSSTGCSCHSSQQAVKCGSDFPLLHFGYCTTYNSTTETTEVGPCPYIAHYNTTSVDYLNYIQLPNNVSLLNEFMS